MRTKPSSKDESPKDRFKRLATARTRAVLEKLRVLGHCANDGLYEYSQNDVEKIFRAISSEVKKTKSKFLARYSGEAEGEFTLE